MLVAACGGALLSDGESQFRGGRYAEARQTLVALEGEAKIWDDAKRAEYALYRGLTHAAMNERAAANVWLNEARAIEGAHPGSLSTDGDIQRLRAALRAIDPP